MACEELSLQPAESQALCDDSFWDYCKSHYLEPENNCPSGGGASALDPLPGPSRLPGPFDTPELPKFGPNTVAAMPNVRISPIQSPQPSVDPATHDTEGQVISFNGDRIRPWLTQDPIHELRQALGVVSVSPSGEYQYASHIPSDYLFRSLLLHLLEADGGPYKTSMESVFNTAVTRFNCANKNALVRVGVSAEELKTIWQRRTQSTIKQEEPDVEMGTLNFREDMASYASARVQELYTLAMSVAVKYQHLELRYPPPNCGAASIDSGFLSSLQASRMPTPNPGNTPGPLSYTSDDYYGLPIPDSLEDKTARSRCHPAFEYPIHSSLNWIFTNSNDCRDSPLTPSGWIPPTSCSQYRAQLAKELFECMKNEEGILDGGQTRVYLHWKKLNNLQFEYIAQKTIIKIHKLHMHKEEAESMLFFERVQEIKETLRVAKGTCYYISKESQGMNLVVDPKGKRNTFKYNQDSNKRKKQREEEHAALHEHVYGQPSPWKLGKKRATVPSSAPPPRLRMVSAPVGMMRPFMAVADDLYAAKLREKERQELVESGESSEDLGTPSLAPGSASAKRKRAPSILRQVVESDGEQEEDDDLYEPSAKKCRPLPTSAVRTHRKIAPAPAPDPRLRQMSNSVAFEGYSSRVASDATMGSQAAMNAPNASIMGPPTLPSLSLGTAAIGAYMRELNARHAQYTYRGPNQYGQEHEQINNVPDLTANSQAHNAGYTYNHPANIYSQPGQVTLPAQEFTDQSQQGPDAPMSVEASGMISTASLFDEDGDFEVLDNESWDEMFGNAQN